MEIKKEELKKEAPDTAQIPLGDAELEEAAGGAESLIRGGWTCPGCKVLYSGKRSPCPACGYES